MFSYLFSQNFICTIAHSEKATFLCEGNLLNLLVSLACFLFDSVLEGFGGLPVPSAKVILYIGLLRVLLFIALILTFYFIEPKILVEDCGETQLFNL